MNDPDETDASRRLLLEEISTLEDIQGKLAANEKREDDGFRMELATLRRQAWEHINSIKRISRTYFDMVDEPEIKKDFCELLVHMDQVQFEHQRKWRGLDVDHNDARYRSSVQQVMRTNRELTDWARKKI